MTDPSEDPGKFSRETELAEFAHEITGRLQSGDPLDDHELLQNPRFSGPIRRLLPLLRTMVALGQQASRKRRSDQSRTGHADENDSRPSAVNRDARQL
jgi:hypothetical protein